MTIILSMPDIVNDYCNSLYLLCIFYCKGSPSKYYLWRFKTTPLWVKHAFIFPLLIMYPYCKSNLPYNIVPQKNLLTKPRWKYLTNFPLLDPQERIWFGLLYNSVNNRKICVLCSPADYHNGMLPTIRGYCSLGHQGISVVM